MAIAYATWNPSDKNSNITLSGGNLTGSNTIVNHVAMRATVGKASGKWYWEINVISNVGTMLIGVGNATMSIVTGQYVGSNINGWGYYIGGTKYNNGTSTAYGATYTNGDVIGVALDMDGGTITMYKNNTSQGTMFTGLTGTLFPAISLYGVSSLSANFGATTLTYSPPSGYFAGIYSGSIDSAFFAFL